MRGLLRALPKPERRKGQRASTKVELSYVQFSWLGTSGGQSRDVAMSFSSHTREDRLGEGGASAAGRSRAAYSPEAHLAPTGSQGHSHHLTSGRGDKAGMVSPLRFTVILAPPPISCVALSQSLLLSET